MGYSTVLCRQFKVWLCYICFEALVNLTISDHTTAWKQEEASVKKRRSLHKLSVISIILYSKKPSGQNREKKEDFGRSIHSPLCILIPANNLTKAVNFFFHTFSLFKIMCLDFFSVAGRSGLVEENLGERLVQDTADSTLQREKMRENSGLS